MAGAVSAGAYTAGVIDYLIETLERWQQQKEIIRNKIDKNIPLSDTEQLVPLHDVVIEVLSGASAGGMTAAVLAYSFNDGTYITKREGQLIPGNYNQPLSTDEHTKLYHSWINMVDDDNGNTFSKLMNTSDIGDVKQLKSFLNSQPIDDIAAKAVPQAINFNNAPAYISPSLSVLLSVTNLEGVPIDIRFSNVTGDNARNVLRMHSGFLHYQFNSQLLSDIDYPAEVIGNQNKSNLAAAAMATGAFPFGLSNRRIVVNKVFFDGFKQNLKINRNLDVNMNLSDEQNAYIFTAVDGGAINNEPMGTTVKILTAKRNLAKKANPSFNDENYMILIDPFPSVTNARQANQFKEPEPYNLLQQAFKIFGAFRNQSAFKQEDLFDGLEMTDKRYLIYPAKRRFYFLACGLIEGFSGFLKKAFRTHDYQLGRKNCQTFLRYYFGEEVSVFEETAGITLTNAQKEIWTYDFNYGKAGAEKLWKMPLIPDMLILEKKMKNEKPDEIAVPGYNGITDKEFDEATSLITKRVEVLTDQTFPLIKNEIKKHNKFVAWCVGLFSGIVKRKIVTATAGKATDYLHKTLLPQTIKQEELVNRYARIIESKGGLYQKSKGIYATVASGGELVISKIQDDAVEEARNIASKGDYIVTGITKSGEQWVIKPESFHKRYKQVNGDYYEPKDTARVYAIQVTAANIYNYGLTELETLIKNPGKAVYIEAAWGESQLISLDSSYLVCPPDKSEIYRIAKSAFDETYDKVG